LNLDKLGLALRKSIPRLFEGNLDVFQGAVQWIAYVIGQPITRATLCPYTERWLFYNESGEFMFALSHDLVDRIDNALRQRGSAKVHARKASRDSARVGEAYPQWGAITGEEFED
jgi:hypothetical protein